MNDHTSPEGNRPVQPGVHRGTPHRLLGVDAARGVALLGMMAVHVTPAVHADGSSTTAHLLASGRASALFALLAGVGLALASGGTTVPRGETLRRACVATSVRAALLVVVGLIIGTLDSGVAVILVYYGLFFVAALPFLGARPVVLLPLAAAWAVLAPVLSHVWRQDMPAGSGGNPTFATLAEPVELLRELVLTGYYPALPWMAYLLAGLGVGRLALGTQRIQLRLLATGVGIAVGTYTLSWALLRLGVMERLVEAGVGLHPTSRPFGDGVLLTSFYGTTPTTSWWWLSIASPHTATPFDLAHTIGVAIAVLALMLLLERRLRVVLAPLAAIGSMTFTLYTLHVVLLASVLPGGVPYALAWHVVIAVAVAWPWRRHVGRGPLEALAAALARGAVQGSRLGRSRD